MSPKAFEGYLVIRLGQGFSLFDIYLVFLDYKHFLTFFWHLTLTTANNIIRNFFLIIKNVIVIMVIIIELKFSQVYFGVSSCKEELNLSRGSIFRLHCRLLASQVWTIEIIIIGILTEIIWNFHKKKFDISTRNIRH